MLTLLGLALAAAGIVWTLTPSPGVDVEYSPLVRRPGYRSRRGPRVLVDEAHRNLHHAHGLYGPLARLLTRDGYRVSRSRQPLIPELLAECEVLIVANPRQALPPEEVSAVRQWVYGDGGGLLLVADREPALAAVEALAAAFGAGFGGMREAGTTGVAPAPLSGHPIASGRPEGDLPVERVMLAAGPAVRASGAHGGVEVLAGRAIALEHGRGRVVLLSDAGAITALLVDGVRQGTNNPDAGNAQFALNVMHWLSKLI